MNEVLKYYITKFSDRTFLKFIIMSQDDLEQIIDDDETIPHASSTSAKDIVTSTPFETSRCEKQTKIVYLKTHKVSFKKCACANMHFTSFSARAVRYKTSFFDSENKTI